MVKRVLLALTAAMVAGDAARAQAVVTVTPQRCVWRAGDDAAWAAPAFDDSGWQPYSTWKFSFHVPRIWVRCHANLDSLRDLKHPAIQVHLHAASQAYMNGELAGGSGNMTSAQFSLGDFYTVPLAPASLTPGATVALRIALRDVSQTAPAEILAGDRQALSDHRDSAALAGALGFLPFALCFALIGVVGFMLLGLYVTDRSRLELLLLAIICWLLCDLRMAELCQFALVPISIAVFNFTYCIGQLLEVFWIWFVFRIAGKRVPLFYKVTIALSLWWFLTLFAEAFLGANANLALEALDRAVAPDVFFAAILCTTAPIAAFWPWNRVPRDRRAIAFFCAAWGAADCLRFAGYELNIFGAISDQRIVGVQNYILVLRAATMLCSVLALLTILFREQRRISKERAQYAGEMEAAREIQQYLIPEKLPPTPGLAIKSVYHPSREVGGDFFQVLPDARDGSTLIIVGDVAGKGLKAGMLAALIVGAIRTAFKFTSDPGRILALLNERLQGRGLVTCLAIRIDRDGKAELANAGHLPPYIDGEELALEGALPLGALPTATFPAQRFQLGEGESLLFVSDGVVEARSATGELFGFERTRAISTQPAEAVARTAQAFGQDDDITVLTLSLAAAEVAHA